VEWKQKENAVPPLSRAQSTGGDKLRFPQKDDDDGAAALSIELGEEAWAYHL
jgi:hypothetical protein